MDYEKKYKEALERAKKFEEKYGGGYAEYIFPELAESEDERIKKTIRQLLETARDAHSNTSLAKPFIDAIAWLEKQKEPENTSASTMVPSCWAEKPSLQKEQKPVSISCGHENDAEWSEEDEKTIDDAYCLLCEYAGSLIQRNYGKSSMLYEIANKLKLLRPSWKPSEEQMAALEAATVRYQSTGLKSLYEDLKKL